MPVQYSVYTLSASDTGRIFYVGKGNALRRLREHQNLARTACACHKCRTIRKIWKRGATIISTEVYRTTVEQDAFDHEVELIALFGRNKLTNRTDGGDGATGMTHGPETREKQRQIALKRGISPELREKINAAKRANPLTEEQRRARAETQRGKVMSAEARAKIRAANLGRRMSDEARRKMSEAVRARPKSHYTALRLAAVGRIISDETRRKMSESAKRRPVSFLGQKHSDESRRKMSEAAQGRTFSDETRRKMREAAKRRWLKPLEKTSVRQLRLDL